MRAKFALVQTECKLAQERRKACIRNATKVSCVVIRALSHCATMCSTELEPSV